MQVGGVRLHRTHQGSVRSPCPPGSCKLLLESRLSPLHVPKTHLEGSVGHGTLNYSNRDNQAIHNPAPVKNFSLPKDMGATEERLSGRYGVPGFTWHMVCVSTTGLV